MRYLLAFVLAFAASFLWHSAAGAHSFYDGCCSGADCAPLAARFVFEEKGGFRVIMTALESRAVNPLSDSPVNAFIPMSSVKPSPNADYHLCIWPREKNKPGDARVICFWAALFS